MPYKDCPFELKKTKKQNSIKATIFPNFEALNFGKEMNTKHLYTDFRQNQIVVYEACARFDHKAEINQNINEFLE